MRRIDPRKSEKSHGGERHLAGASPNKSSRNWRVRFLRKLSEHLFTKRIDH